MLLKITKAEVSALEENTGNIAKPKSLGIEENGPCRLLHRERYYRKLERFKNKNRRM